MLRFWRRKPKPGPADLKMTPFSEGKPRTFNEIICDGVAAQNLGSFAALLELHAKLQAEHPDVRVLASLDDLGQAAYTSGHATDVHDLDSLEGHDLTGLDPALFEDGEPPLFLTTPEEFPYRLANVLEKAKDKRFSDACGVLEWDFPDTQSSPLLANHDPETVLMIDREQDVLFQFVPVERAADALAAFPNGYFTSDLDPFQNHALALHLEKSYGLALFGVGSRFLGFRSDAPLRPDQARGIASDMAALYEGTPEAAVEEMTDLLTGRDWLLLRYTES